MTQAERASELDTLGLESTDEAEDAAQGRGGARRRDRPAHAPAWPASSARSRSRRLPERRDTAALEIEQKTAALEALGPIAKEPRARERLEVEVADAERQLERARDDEADARARVEQNPVDAEEVAGLAERLAGWTEELAVLRRRDRVYARTLAQINAAEQATMQRATRYLERRMVGDVARDHGRSLPPRPRGRHEPGHRRVLARERRLGAGHGPVAGDARRRLPGGAPRPRAARDRRPAAAARPRRPVRHAGRRARRPARSSSCARSPRTSRSST